MTLPVKPTDVPRFATNAPARVEPPETGGSGTTKDTGVIPGTRTPAQYVNWIFYTIYTWVLWLQSLTDQALSWTNIQTFLKGIVVTQSTANGHGVQSDGNGSGVGGYFTGGNSDAVGCVGRGAPGHNGDGGLFFSSGVGKGLRCNGGSSSAGGEALLATGALLGTAVHSIACVDGYSLLVEQTTTGGLHYDKPAARIVAQSVCLALEVIGGSDAGHAATFLSGTDAQGAVDIGTVGSDPIYGLRVSCSGSNGSAIEVGAGHLRCTGTPPGVSVDVGRNNVLHADLIPKAWGYIKISGPTAGGYPNSTNLTFAGTNIASVVYTNNQAILVTLVRGLTNTNYAVATGEALSSGGGPGANVYKLDVLNVTSDTFKIQTSNASNGSFDTSGFNGTISFQVFGHQS